MSSTKLDFRFAVDEVDAADIERLVNKCYSKECGTSESQQFRVDGPRVTLDDIDNGPNRARWVVLETQPPEEDVVATARLYFDEDENSGCVDIFCASGDNDAVIAERLAYLLFKLEGVVNGHNYKSLSIEVTQWQEDIQDWLNKAGYEDRGGYVWPEERAHLLLKPTMILRFKKDLRTARNVIAEGAATREEAPEFNEHNLEDIIRGISIDIDGESGVSTADGDNGPTENMDDIFNQLFKALHAEYPVEDAQPKND